MRNRYLFDRVCEHKLLYTRNSSAVDIDIRIDFLDSDISSANIVILYNNHSVNITNSPLMVYDPPITPDIVITQGNENVAVRIPDISFSLIHEKKYITIEINQSFPLSGLCGTKDGNLVFSDGSRQANASDDTSLSNFIDSYSVQPPDQKVRNNRKECGKFVSYYIIIITS